MGPCLSAWRKRSSAISRAARRLATTRGASLWERGGGKDQFRSGDKIPKRVQLTTRRLRHSPTVRPVDAECKQSVFSINALFRHHQVTALRRSCYTPLHGRETGRRGDPFYPGSGRRATGARRV